MQRHAARTHEHTEVLALDAYRHVVLVDVGAHRAREAHGPHQLVRELGRVCGLLLHRHCLDVHFRLQILVDVRRRTPSRGTAAPPSSASTPATATATAGAAPAPPPA